jgi:hypothetical protein
MLTRMKDTRPTLPTRRLLGRNGWKASAGLLAASVLSLAMTGGAHADDGAAGVVRVSDHPIQTVSAVANEPTPSRW